MAQALASAFHDVVWALVGISAVGLVLAPPLRAGASEDFGHQEVRHLMAERSR